MLPLACPLSGFREFFLEEKRIMTVNGMISPHQAGFILPHEHILVDFIGADQINPARYKEIEVFDTALPYLAQAKNSGAQTLVECTPAWLGRNPRLMQKLSRTSGLHIITNTGYYGAAQEKYLPPHTYSASAEQLARRWILEWEEGIDGSGIRPGFIKTGVDIAPLSAVQRKLIKAAALTHLETGLTIYVHTGDGKAALEELSIIKDMGVKAEAWVWVHAQNEADRSIHLQVAREGGWVSFDGLNQQSVAQYVQFLKDMKAHQLLHKALVSHDAGWYHVGEPNGGHYRSYETLFTHLIPALKNNAFTNEDLQLLFSTNPAKALAISIEKRQ